MSVAHVSNYKKVENNWPRRRSLHLRLNLPNRRARLLSNHEASLIVPKGLPSRGLLLLNGQRTYRLRALGYRVPWVSRLTMAHPCRNPVRIFQVQLLVEVSLTHDLAIQIRTRWPIGTKQKWQKNQATWRSTLS